MGSCRRLALSVFLITIAANSCEARVRMLQLENDPRPFVEITKFGFLANGTLEVHLNDFRCPDMSIRKYNEPVGLILSQDETVLEFEKSYPGGCYFTPWNELYEATRALFFFMDFKRHKLDVKIANFPSFHIVDLYSGNGVSAPVATNGTTTLLPSYTVEFLEENGRFEARFKVVLHKEGYYMLTYHDCKQSIDSGKKKFFLRTPSQGSSFKIELFEKNPDGYLSHGEMPVPSIYMVFSAVFFALFCFWVFILLSKKENVYRIHVLMGVLVLLKSMSVMLHGLNLYFIGIHGQQVEAWAVLYYILHLIKGSLLFGTIILIGTGWTLFKNFLVERDRKLLMVVIPLQVIDNIALIVLAETEIGQQRYEWTSKLFILFDLICCAAVIIPILWSIKHLEQASRTDGKAAFNLQKLRLFQQFYIIVICYVYLTRIVKYLLQFTIPFKYMWITTVIEELGTALLFVWTGAKFKPAPNNPYLRLSQSDDDDEAYALTQSGILEDVIFLSSKHKSKRDANTDDKITLEEALME